MFNNFLIVFVWWFLLFGLGVITLPFTFYLFRRFFDQGYAFSKITAILFISYFIWLLGGLRILPFYHQTIWLVILLSAGINYWLAKRKGINLKKIIRKNWPIFVFEEALFFVSLLFWSLVRSYQPGIHGLEKFMDFGFVNSILRSHYFPPVDMWLAGETINYYYFGHLVAAVLTKLSGISSAITYNLMIATIFGLCFTAAFSLGGNFVSMMAKNNRESKKKTHALFMIRDSKFIILAGLLTAAILTLSGNFHPLYWFLKHGNFKTYWYPDATRFIVQKFGAADNTIHEFPIYSFVVADLHGHLLNLPFVLLFIGLLTNLFIDLKKKSLSSITYHLSPILGLCLAVFYMTNTWDFAIYFLVLGGIVLYSHYLNYGLKSKTLTQTALFMIPNLLLTILFSLPFHLHFQTIAEGIKLVDFRSPPWMFLVLWGFPLLITLGFLTLLAKKEKAPITTDSLILIILAVAWFLILVPEVIYVKDIYTHSHQRANTMFKLTYQSFVMFSLTVGYIIFRILASFKKSILKFFYVVLIFSFLFFIFIYPFYAVRSYYGLKSYQGLDGLSYLQQLYPDDHQAITWLKENTKGQPIIAEAVGESYTDFARVSANTGLPTILGWRVHEWLWRGSFDEAGKRTEIVQKIYESPNLQETQQLLTQYRVEFVFLGSLERQQYPHLREEKFDQIGKVVFRSGETKVYYTAASESHGLF